MLFCPSVPSLCCWFLPLQVLGEVFTPEDGRDWELSKAFLGCSLYHVINLFQHYRTHLVADSMATASLRVLPGDHPLLLLLSPHLECNLSLDRSVLWSSLSAARYEWAHLQDRWGSYVFVHVNDLYVLSPL